MTGYNRLDHVLRIQLGIKSGGAAPETIAFPQVPTNRVWRIDTLAFQDATTGFTDARVYLVGGGEKFYLGQITTLALGQVGSFSGPYYVSEGMSIAIDFTGTVNADQLKAYLNGVELCADGPDEYKQIDAAAPKG